MSGRSIKTAAAVGLTAILTAAGTIKFLDYRNRTGFSLTRSIQDKFQLVRDLAEKQPIDKPKSEISEEAVDEKLKSETWKEFSLDRTREKAGKILRGAVASARNAPYEQETNELKSEIGEKYPLVETENTAKKIPGGAAPARYEAYERATDEKLKPKIGKKLSLEEIQEDAERRIMISIKKRLEEGSYDSGCLIDIKMSVEQMNREIGESLKYVKDPKEREEYEEWRNMGVETIKQIENVPESKRKEILEKFLKLYHSTLPLLEEKLNRYVLPAEDATERTMRVQDERVKPRGEDYDNPIRAEVTVSRKERPERGNMHPEGGPTRYSIGNDERTKWRIEGAAFCSDTEKSTGFGETDPLEGLEDIVIRQNGTRIRFKTVNDKLRKNQIGTLFTQRKYAPVTIEWAGTYNEGKFEAAAEYFDRKENVRQIYGSDGELGEEDVRQMYHFKEDEEDMRHIYRFEGELDEEDGCIRGVLWDTRWQKVFNQEQKMTVKYDFELWPIPGDEDDN